MTDLIKLLADIPIYRNNPAQLEKAFDEIAVTLLRHAKIVTPKESFYIREIEIYFYDEFNHPDPYAHQHSKQRRFGEWYFHWFKTADGFLNSSRNGVDITFGDNNLNLFGGILIRKIQNIRSLVLIHGINIIARELIKDFDNRTIEEIASDFSEKAFDTREPLHIEMADNNINTPIYKTQRNGLRFNEKKDKGRVFFKKPYCYYNHDLNLSKIIEVSPAS